MRARGYGLARRRGRPAAPHAVELVVQAEERSGHGPVDPALELEGRVEREGPNELAVLQVDAADVRVPPPAPVEAADLVPGEAPRAEDVPHEHPIPGGEDTDAERQACEDETGDGDE